MSTVNEIPPLRSPDLTFSPVDREGHFVVKNQRKRKYLRLGQREYFLLNQLDGRRTFGEIMQGYEQVFGEALTPEDMKEFLSLAKKEDLLGVKSKPSPASAFSLSQCLVRSYRAMRKQSLLYFRVKLFDPDRCLDRLAPATRFLFEPWFAMLASAGGIWALLISWMYREELVQSVTSQLGFQTVVMFWLITIFVTVLHEFGHGLACKKYGGEVHEMGVLWIFFTPCLYCNVSDAWLIPRRGPRLLISMAGTYIDLLVWIVGVALWRLTAPGTFANMVSWVLIGACGVRLIFNLNPLLRLDGYYALSDLLGQPNLRLRARDCLMGYVRWFLWGAPWPRPQPNRWVLLSYGLTCWVFVVGFLGLLSFQLSTWLSQFMGIGGVLAAGSFFLITTKSFFRGSLGEEFMIMFRKRIWRLLIVLGLLIGVMFVPITDRAGGDFIVKPVMHWEVRAPIAGFLKEIHVAEGVEVEPGSTVVSLEIPELSNQISRKLAEIAESEANLRRLTTGARIEDIHEQRERIKRAVQWCEQGQSNLQRAEAAYQRELETLEFQIEQARIELDYRRATYEQSQLLFDKGGMAQQQLMSQERLVRDAEAQLHIAESQKKAREATGTVDAQTELAKRQKELEDERAKLTLLEAGSRTEDIEAERARLLRLEEELRIFREQETKQFVCCPVRGTVTTARLQDKIGQFVERGTVIFVVEDLNQLEAEISIPEHFAESVQQGQPIALKPRFLPSQTLSGTVLRVAPAVQSGVATNSSALTVYCRFDNRDGVLRAGMTGYGRIYQGETNVAGWLYRRGVRMLRTEFWW